MYRNGMAETRPWKKVHSYSRRPAGNGYALHLVLECGHEVGRKQSQGVPARVRCLLCPPEVKSVK